MKYFFTIGFVLTVAFNSYAQTEIFHSFLQENCSDVGVVSYKNAKANPENLNSYIAYLQKTKVQENWSANKEKAFWINAYNAYTIQLILDHYPLKSILDIRIKGKDAWNHRFAVVGGETYTLNEIEHEILRKKFTDPRIHVGVNCASFSCPPLFNIAFTEENIEEHLEQLMHTFVNDTHRNELTTKKVKLSKIFEWYQEDFVRDGSLIAYLQKYSEVPLTSKTKVRYLEYNWNLNE